MATVEDNTYRYRQLVEAFNRHDSDDGADRYHEHATVTDHGMGESMSGRAVRRFYEVFTTGDVEALDGLLADDFISHVIPAELGIGRDRMAALQFAQMHAAAFPDLHVEVLDLIAADDRVAVRARLTGTHEGAFVRIPASGRTVEHEFADVARFNDHGELVESWNYADSLAVAQQLQPGQVSAP